MRLLFGLIIPLILLLTPVIFQITFSILRIKQKSKFSLTKIGIISFLLGCITPVAATFIAMHGFSYGINPNKPNCIVGIELFMFLGFFLTLIIIPITGIFCALVLYQKNKKEITRGAQL